MGESQAVSRISIRSRITYRVIDCRIKYTVLDEGMTNVCQGDWGRRCGLQAALQTSRALRGETLLASRSLRTCDVTIWSVCMPTALASTSARDRAILKCATSGAFFGVDFCRSATDCILQQRIIPATAVLFS